MSTEEANPGAETDDWTVILFGSIGSQFMTEPIGTIFTGAFFIFFFSIWNCSIGPMLVAPLVKLILRRPGGGISPICICPHWIVGIFVPYTFFGVVGILVLVLPAYIVGVLIGLDIVPDTVTGGSMVPGTTNNAPTTYDGSVDCLRAATNAQINEWMLADQGTCGICMDVFTINASREMEVVQFPCSGKHKYHRSCLKEWVTSQHGYGPTQTCPACREPMPSRSEVLAMQARETVDSPAAVAIPVSVSPVNVPPPVSVPPVSAPSTDAYRVEESQGELIF